MTPISQFKPALYVLLMLGVSGFALASQSPGIWLLGAGGIALNAWMNKTRRYRPMPRFLANVVTLGALVVIVQRFTMPSSVAVLLIGDFLVILHLVKLWELRSNRDYAQLILLSMLLMVAAAINATSLIFGILLLAYMLLALYCSLLFHLKVEASRVQELEGTVPPESEPAPESASPAGAASSAATSGRAPSASLSGESPRRSAVQHTVIDQHQAVRSLRRVCGLVVVGSLLVSVFVFLFFPRTSTPLASALQLQDSAMTGFADRINFDAVANIQQNEEEVAFVRVIKNGQPLRAGSTIYLRGIGMNRYRGTATDPPREGRESRSRGGFQRDPSMEGSEVPAAGGDRATNFRVGQNAPKPPPASWGPIDYYEQSVQLLPTGTKVLFEVSGVGADGDRVAMPHTITPVRDLMLKYGNDGAVVSQESLPRRVDYKMTSDNAFDTPIGPRVDDRSSLLSASEQQDVMVVNRRMSTPAFLHNFGFTQNDKIVSVDGAAVATLPPDVDVRSSLVRDALLAGKPVTVQRGTREVTLPYVPPEILAFASRPDVSGRDETGAPLIAQRRRFDPPGPLDAKIAANIANYLRDHFTYTLDITDASERRDQDPILWFLSDKGQRGHCEYFAGAMTLLCQSLGMTSRVVIGFKCDEFNPFNEHFVVRQSHAHAWVEVLTPEGWRMYDPTSSRSADAIAANDGLLQRLKHLMGWLDFNYAQSVIAYDNDQREGLLQTVENEMTRPLYEGVNSDWITARLSKSKLWKAMAAPSAMFVRAVSVTAVVAVLLLVARHLVLQWKLRKRAERIGLEALPEDEQKRLAIQLAFYDELILMLEKRNFVRQAHQTPLEFARGLLFLPTSAYRTVTRLTQVFYRVRYGDQRINDGLQKRLTDIVGRLDHELGPPKTA